MKLSTVMRTVLNGLGMILLIAVLGLVLYMVSPSVPVAKVEKKDTSEKAIIVNVYINCPHHDATSIPHDSVLHHGRNRGDVVLGGLRFPAGGDHRKSGPSTTLPNLYLLR